ncbi:MAG: hypothetical protein ACFB21_07780 [Opitutales bacterium]
MRFLRKYGGPLAAAALGCCSGFGTLPVIEITLDPEAEGTVDDRLFGHFLEIGVHNESGPEAAWDPETGALRENVVAQLRKMAIPVLRFPGGVALESVDFRWTHLIDNAPDRLKAERPARLRSDGALQTHAFGLDEFLALCAELGAEPLLVVKLTDMLLERVPPEEVLAQARAMLAYCNLPVDADVPVELRRWALLRARNGNPEPFGVKYWQLGNEFVWYALNTLRERGLSDREITDAYVNAVVEMVEALRAVDPNIELIAENYLETDGVRLPVTAAFAERLGDRIAFVSSHFYKTWGIDKLSRGGEPVRFAEFRPEDFWNAAASAPGTDARGQSHFFSFEAVAAERHGYPIALTEWNWNSWWGDKVEETSDGAPVDPPPFTQSIWAKGMGAVSILHALMRSDFPIRLATQSMLIGNAWSLASIGVAEGGAVLRPSGAVTALYSRLHGDRRIGWRSEQALPGYAQPFTVGGLSPSDVVAYLDLVVTVNDEQLFLHALNRHQQQALTLMLETGCWVAETVRTATHYSLTESGQPSALVEETQTPLDRKGRRWHIVLPPASISAVALPRE